MNLLSSIAQAPGLDSNFILRNYLKRLRRSILVDFLNASHPLTPATNSSSLLQNVPTLNDKTLTSNWKKIRGYPVDNQLPHKSNANLSSLELSLLPSWFPDSVDGKYCIIRKSWFLFSKFLWLLRAASSTLLISESQADGKCIHKETQSYLLQN